MPMERRETREANQNSQAPEICTDGFLKGYARLHWIAARASGKDRGGFKQLMHHLNVHNLKRAFRGIAGNKAAGVDGITKREYGKQLEENIAKLHERIHSKAWRPKPSREVLIPKPQGGVRPLAVGCMEDKIVQTLTARILEAVYDSKFHRNSFGFRPGKSAHMAIQKLYASINQRRKRCVVVEMDIKSFFNSVKHDWLMQQLQREIADTHFLGVVYKLLTASTLHEDGQLAENTLGTPQGSPVSPVLANICLHYLLDTWFDENYGGKGEMVRYADDAVFVFSDIQTATNFQVALKQRMAVAGLELNDAKSGLLVFNLHKPQGTVPFLGFEFYWGLAQVNKPTLKVKTATKSLGRSLQAFDNWLKENRNRVKTQRLLRGAAAKVRGHFRYFGVTFNQHSLISFFLTCQRHLFKWLNRRSQRPSYTWEGLCKVLNYLKFPAPPLGYMLLDITKFSSAVNLLPKSRMRKLRKSGSERSVGRSYRPAFT